MMNGLENWAINAYADGELDAAERAAVERQLADNPDARRVLENIQRQKSALRGAFDSVLNEPVPHSMARTLLGAGTRKLGPYAAMAASLAMLAIGGAGGWFAAHGSGSTLVADIGRRALVAHEVYAVEVRHPVEVAANESDHITKWFSKRLGTAVKIPDLAAAGYTFIGGRLLAAEDRPAGQLMYEDANKKRVTIFLSSNPSKVEDAIRVKEKDKLVSCYWSNHELAMAITGEMPVATMMNLAHAIYDQMEAG
jgi:anti-sigma factor RsiW